MKNRKLLYLLLPLTLFIWGMIIIRVLDNLKAPEKSSGFDPLIYTDNSEKPQEDTVPIIANYPDPFLDRKLTSMQKNSKRNLGNQENIAQVRLKPEVNWPSIKYGGFISNKGSKSTLCLLQVDGTNRLVKPGESTGLIKLVKAYPDSVVVEMRHIRKLISKEKL